ncbi:MAG TPA: GTPase Era [Candidatus Omnitrophica bacterium]|nr:GTPase Era [Candidatus Omnitrophota bacterium]
MGQKVSIVSKIPQTTRNIIRGVLTEERGQVVFVDTPGLHKPKHHLGKYMNVLAEDSARGADVVLHLVDSSENTGEEETMIVNFLSRQLGKLPIILVLNKIDLGGRFIQEYLKLWEAKSGKLINELSDKLIVIPVSALKGTGLDKLLEVLFSYMPKGPQLYPEDMVSDFPDNLAYADIIRQKLFERMRQEIPYSIGVLIEEVIERTKELTFIKAVILVERDSQKAMVIGDKGRVIKEVGSASRKELEGMLDKKVYLELTVKTNPDWREDKEILKRMGIIQ